MVHWNTHIISIVYYRGVRLSVAQGIHTRDNRLYMKADGRITHPPAYEYIHFIRINI